MDALWTGYHSLINNIQRLTHENEEKEIRKAKADLALLQTKINPHFLFNSLDFIQDALERGQTENGCEAIRQLSDFYRRSLNRGQDLVSLKEELDHVRSYMALLHLCFDSMITLEIQVPEALMNTPLPRMTLQPLIENAYQHGFIRGNDLNGRIRITASRISDSVEITVWDNGQGIPAEQLPHIFDVGHVGLSNTNNRIRLSFGSGWGLSVDSMENSYTEVNIRVPHRDVERSLM